MPGGIIAPPEILNYAGGWGRELCPEETWKKRIGLDMYPLLNFGFQIAQPDELRHTMVTGEPYKIHATWLQQNNTLSCMSADPQETYAGLMNCDFNVSVDLFMTPTIMATSDVVLPAATFPERDGIRVGDGVQRGEVINKVCQVGECKSDMEINLLLGKRFNPEAWPWENVDEMFSAMLEAQTPYSFQDVREKGPIYLPFSYKRYETAACAPTDSRALARRRDASSCGRRSTIAPAWTRCPTSRSRCQVPTPRPSCSTSIRWYLPPAPVPGRCSIRSIVRSSACATSRRKPTST